MSDEQLNVTLQFAHVITFAAAGAWYGLIEYLTLRCIINMLQHARSGLAASSEVNA